MRGGAGAVRVPDFARGIKQDRMRRGAPIGRELVLLLRRNIPRLAGRRRDHRQPHHALPRPFLLQGLHVVAAIMFANIRASWLVHSRTTVLPLKPARERLRPFESVSVKAGAAAPMSAWAVANCRPAPRVMIVVAQQRPMANIRRRPMMLTEGHS